MLEQLLVVSPKGKTVEDAFILFDGESYLKCLCAHLLNLNLYVCTI